MTRNERRARARDAIEWTALAVVFFIALGFLLYLEFHEPETAPAAPAAVPVQTRVVTRPAEELPEPAPVIEEPEVLEPELHSLGEFKITHYCPCPKCCGEWADGITYTGTTATEGRTIAVDPKVIPLGSRVVIDGQEYIAEDIGGAIKGSRIDVFMDDHHAALVAGVKKTEVFIYE